MVEEVLGPIVVSYEKTGGNGEQWCQGGGLESKNRECQTGKETVHELVYTAHFVVVPM